MTTYTIYPLALSKPIEEPAAAFYYKRYKGEPVFFAYGCFCLKNNETEELVMIDTGLASQEDIEKYNYPFRKMEGAPKLGDLMASKGLDPLKVKYVFFTHLHQDHCFNLELFPNATMYVQKKELMHAVSPNPIEYKSYQKFNLPGLPAWARAWGQIQTIEGDVDDLVDGLEVLFTPGHTPGSQSVVVDTKEGKYVCCGDLFYTQEQLDKELMNGNFTGLEDWYASIAKIKRYMREHNAKPLAVHSPDSYKEDTIG